MKYNITRDEFFNFIKVKNDSPENVSKSTQHYLNFYDKYLLTGRKGSWNWCAFFSFWLFHRRMYLYGFGYVFFYSTVGYFLWIAFSYLFLMPESKEWEEIFGRLPGLLCGILLMRYADFIYLRYAAKKITEGITERGINHWAISALCLIASVIGAGFFLFIFSQV